MTCPGSGRRWTRSHGATDLDARWIWAAGALAAVLLLGIGVWLALRGRGGRIGTPEVVAAAADEALGGFRTVGAVVGGDSAAALAVDAADRVALCRPRGRRLVVDEIAWGAIRAAPDGLVVDTGNRAVLIVGVDALDVRRMRAQEARSAASASPM